MLCWNVYISDYNRGEIKIYNIFNHHSFYETCVKLKKKFKDNKEEFAKEVRSWLMYFFWSKCEWEIVLQHWPSGELYELREGMKIGELCDALNEHGIPYPKPGEWNNRTNADREVTIKVFPVDNRFRDKKIDVFDQVTNNWDVFIDYLWDHRKELKARKTDG